MPGPHGFAVRFSAVRQRALDRSQAKARPAISLRARRCRVHRIPYPTSVTIAIRPSAGRDGEGCRFDLGLSKTEIFLKRGLDRQITDLPVGQNRAAIAPKPPHEGDGFRFAQAIPGYCEPKTSANVVHLPFWTKQSTRIRTY